MTRRSAAKTSTHDRDVEHARQAVPFLTGRLLDVSISGGGLAIQEHGLGRAYVGAWVIGQTGNNDLATIATPEATASAGQDPAKVILLDPIGAGFTGTIRLWVF